MATQILDDERLELEQSSSPSAEPSGLNEIVPILRSSKLFIVLFTIAGAALAALGAFMIPVRYTATATIMPPQQAASSASALASQLGSLASAVPGGSSLGLRSQADLYMGLLASRTIADNLISRFDLRKIYAQNTQVDTLKKLTSRTHFLSGRDTLIKISVEDRDPKRAAAIANGYVEELYKQNNRLAITESSQRRLFFERQVDEEKEALNQAEASLKATETRTGVLSVNGQVDSVIRANAQLRAEISSREVELQRLRSGATEQNPAVIKLETEISALRTELAKLQTSSPGKAGDPFVPTASVPAASIEYLRAFRDLSYHESLFELLSKQYEAARIDEAREAAVIQVVDPAAPPDKKSYPSRSTFTVEGTLVTAFIACWAAVFRFRRKTRRNVA